MGVFDAQNRAGVEVFDVLIGAGIVGNRIGGKVLQINRLGGLERARLT